MRSSVLESISTKCLRLAGLALAVLLPPMLMAQSAPAHLKVLHTFSGGSDGGVPAGDLLQDAKGNLHGTTTTGGQSSGCGSGTGCGVVFKLNKAAHETVLYTFTGGADGGQPEAGLVRDTAGNLYGTTYFGGDLPLLDTPPT